MDKGSYWECNLEEEYSRSNWVFDGRGVLSWLKVGFGMERNLERIGEIEYFFDAWVLLAVGM